MLASQAGEQAVLVHLTIENFAIIDRIDLDLGPGLVALTGETGAGKSIVIDAVGGVLGQRLGPDVIRAGADAARIEAIIAMPPITELRDLLEEFGIPVEDDTLILGREISRSGRSIGRVNGRAVPLGCLQRLGRLLVDIHGQGDHLTLLRVAEHQRFLDGYAGLDAVREEVARLAQELKAVRSERDELVRSQRDAERQADLLRYQIGEIEAARLHPGEDDELRQERTLLANAERLAAAVDQVREALTEAERDSAVDRLSTAATLLAEISRIDPSVAEEQNVLEALVDQVTELSRRLRRYRERIEVDPARLAEVEERLELIRSLQRKYGGTIEEVLAFADRARRELDQLVHHEERLLALAERESVLTAALAAAAVQLSQERAEAGARLAAEIESELAELNMAGARFRVVLDQQPDPNGIRLPDGRVVAFDATGIDRVEFFIATNPGEDFKPLVRVVSGGETARVMLALKNVLSRADPVPTLIFDEIDAGIGGRTAVIVGQKIARLARNRQILCVTHLPQIAAFADIHVGVSKVIVDGRTVTEARVLGGEERVDELAAMIGAQGDWSSARGHARELIEAANAFKMGWLAAQRGTAP